MGFKLTLWDYLTFVSILAAGIAILVILLWLAGLPGKIAISRKHPDAEAVKVMGYAGFLAVVPWINAFIWAFKPTDIIDIRRLPTAEARAIDEEIAHLRGEDDKPSDQASDNKPRKGKSPPDSDTTD